MAASETTSPAPTEKPISSSFFQRDISVISAQQGNASRVALSTKRRYQTCAFEVPTVLENVVCIVRIRRREEEPVRLGDEGDRSARAAYPLQRNPEPL